MQVNISNAEEGVVSGRATPGGHMDAAIVRTLAGFELELERVAVRSDAREGGARLTLSIEMDPASMREFAVMLAQKSGLPAFTEHEWTQIANALDVAAKHAAPGNYHGASWTRIAREIREEI